MDDDSVSKERHRGLMLSSSPRVLECFVFQLRAKFQRRNWRRSSTASTLARKLRLSSLELSVGVGVVVMGSVVLVCGFLGRR